MAATDWIHSGLLEQSYVLDAVSALIEYLLPSLLITLDSSPNANTRFATNCCTCSPPPHDASPISTAVAVAPSSARRHPFTFTVIQTLQKPLRGMAPRN